MEEARTKRPDGLSPREGQDSSLDWRYAVLGAGDTILRLWELESGRKVCTYKGHEASVDAVAFTPDRHYAVLGLGGHNGPALESDWERQMHPHF